MKFQPFFPILFLALAIAFTAWISCGDDDDDNDDNDSVGGDEDDDDGSDLQCEETFGPDTACGGNPIGEWTLIQMCTDYDYEALVKKLCNEATLTLVDYEVTGILNVTGVSTVVRISSIGNMNG